MSKTVQELTDKTFEQTLKEHEVVVVDCYADWCSPCKTIAPIIEKLSEELPNVKFVKVDVDDNEQLVETYDIVSIPTLILFKNGKKLDEFVGASTKADIKNWIKETLERPETDE